MYRHLALYRRSWPRLLELAYWPVLQMCIWGFTASFFAARLGSAAAIASASAGRRAAVGGGAAQPDGHGDLLPGGNVVAQPRPRLRQPAAPVGAGGGADRHVGHPHARRRAAGSRCWPGCFYAFNLFAFGPVLVLFFINLMIMGWWVALARVSADPAPRRGRRGAGLVGAVRADAVLGGILSGRRAAGALRPIALALPSAHVFEGMRGVLLHGVIPWDHLAWAFGLNGLAEPRRAAVRLPVPSGPGARRTAEHRRMTSETRFWLIRHALVDENSRAILYGMMDVPLCETTL